MRDQRTDRGKLMIGLSMIKSVFRYNDPERMTPVTPQAKDLGQTVRLLADDIRTFGLELIRLGAEFHRDPNFNGDDEAKENFRRLIQVS